MVDTITRPVDLIVANELHDAAARIERIEACNPKLNLFEPLFGDPATRRAISESCARQLLCAIAHQGAMDRVLAALAAVGAPATLTELDQRFTAVRDQRRGEKPASGGPPAPSAQPGSGGEPRS